MTDPLRFPFRFDPRYRIAAAPFGVTPGRCWLTVDDHEVSIHFGWWSMRIERDNIASVQVSGPYRFLKTAGPAHLSMVDHGITFASNGDRGVCLKLVRAEPGIEPTGRLKHPGVTVTVADPDGLAQALS